MKEHLLIRRELRVSFSTVLAGWTAERRRSYLLRHNTVPASVDHEVWPRAQGGASVEVAVAVVGPNTALLQNWLGEAELPLFQAQGWLPLGYDVCDSVLASGLLNCGYSDGEQELFANRWGSKVNRWHLFDFAEDAFKFAELTDSRVPEHAPFGVFRLYVAQSVDIDAAWRDAQALRT